ncbi:MAG: NAD(P)H-binding protein [Planctomycetes bacterium]|nr:NAD(P)H-binding protein [Planctomycetota bacterium]
MKLLVLGASGKCGIWVVRLAKERGHAVTAVVREESEYEAPEGVMVKKGQVTEAEFVKSILTDQKVIISCVGLRRAGASPTSRILSPPDIVQSVMGNVIDCMSEGSRLIWISAGGVGSSNKQSSWFVRRLIRLGSLGAAYKDLEAAERLVEQAEINSLAVRPVTLVKGAPRGNAGPTDRYGLFSTVRRSDVAQWMLDVADGSRSFEDKNVLLGTVS